MFFGEIEFVMVGCQKRFFFFFFERNLIGIVSNSCEIDFLFFLRREGFKLRYL